MAVSPTRSEGPETAEAAVAAEGVDQPRPRTARLYGTAPAALAEALREAGFEVVTEGSPQPGPAALHCVPLLGEPVYGHRGPAPALPRAELLTALERAARGGGDERLVLVTDATPFVHPETDPDASAALAAELAWWRWLTMRAAAEGVSANTVRLGYAPFLGHVAEPLTAASLHRHQLVRRPAEPADLATALTVLTGPGTSYVAGETIALDGGLDSVYIPPAKPFGIGKVPEPVHHQPDDGPVLVVGASSGIGAATARALAAEGVETVLVARREAALEKVAKAARAAGARTHVLPTDLSDPSAVPGLIRRAEALTGGIGRLCYAAGALTLDDLRNPVENGEAREAMLRANVSSFSAVCDELVSRWIERGTRGSIVSVSSVTADSAPLSHCHSYGATKAAVAQYTRMLATSVARYGIRANCVRPGIIRTPMAGTADDEYQRAWLARVPMNRVGEPEEVAALLCELLSPRTGYLTGTQTLIDGGLHLGAVPPVRSEGALERAVPQAESRTEADATPAEQPSETGVG